MDEDTDLPSQSSVISASSSADDETCHSYDKHCSKKCGAQKSTTHSSINTPKKVNFPLKLYDVLESEDIRIISWLSEGTAFKVLDTPAFRDTILPKYFRTSRIPSFTKQLNLYGFKRYNDGKLEGAYYHPDFNKGSRDIVESMGKMIRDGTPKQPSRVPEKRSGGSTLEDLSRAIVLYHACLFKCEDNRDKVGLNFRNSDQFTGEKYVGVYNTNDEAMAAAEAILDNGDHLECINLEKHSYFQRLGKEQGYLLHFCSCKSMLLYSSTIEVCTVLDRATGYALIRKILSSDDQNDCIATIRSEKGLPLHTEVNVKFEDNNCASTSSSCCASPTDELSPNIDACAPLCKRQKNV